MTPTVADIQAVVAEQFGVRLIEMRSARRARSVARPRQIAMYLAWDLTTLSLPQIGRQFGGRDHTTVMHAINVVTDLIGRDRDLAASIAAVEARLRDPEQLPLFGPWAGLRGAP